MPVSPRLIKRRIRSVANTRKITKAMELVAASKMRKAVQLTLASRSYSGTAKELVDEIRKHVEPGMHAFLSGMDGRNKERGSRVLLIVAASDRGLCGGFNAQLLKKALTFLQDRAVSPPVVARHLSTEARRRRAQVDGARTNSDDAQTNNDDARMKENIRIVTVGRRAEGAVKRAGYDVLASFDAISNAPSFDAAMPVGRLAVQEFVSGGATRIFIAYTDFKSALTQIPTIEQLLPIIPESELTSKRSSPVDAGHWPALRTNKTTHATGVRLPDDDDPSDTGDDANALFEPSASFILNTLLPRLVETRIYQALLESSASEHSARMMSMRSATDNATSMLDDLTFSYNQARQAGITREISEISAGKAAIE